MSLTRLHSRVAKLEAQRAPGGVPGLVYEHPEPSPEWGAEVFRLLQESGLAAARRWLRAENRR
jgi:hypothetical protein